MIWDPGDRQVLERLARARRRGRVAVVDPGSAKIAMGIARWDPEEAVGEERQAQLALAGAESVSTEGYVAGEMRDLRSFERSLREVIDTVERRAGCGRVDDVVIAVDGGIGCHYARGDAAVTGNKVTERDMLRAMRQCGRPVLDAHSMALHALPVHYSLDDRDGIADPRGLTGKRITVDVVWLTVRRGAVRELETCARNCGLRPVGFVAKPYATALGCTSEERGTIACVDMGATTTGASVTVNGKCVFADSIRLGGADVTETISRDLGIDLPEAEAKKRGSTGDGDPEVRAIVVRALRGSMIEVRKMLERAEFSQVPGRIVRLSGGGSNCAGVREAARVLDCKIERGLPRGVWWPSADAARPEYTTLAGLARFARRNEPECWEYQHGLQGSVVGIIGRTMRWMREAW